MMLGILFLLFVLGLVWIYWIEPRAYQINRHEVPLRKDLSRPLSFLHLSDIHFAKTDKLLGRFFDRLAKEDVDFVLVTGDIIDCEEGIPFCVENLKKLRPRFGTFAVFGNHDYFDYRLWDVFVHSNEGGKLPKGKNASARLQKELEAAGIRVLKNQTAEIALNERESVLIHGVDDPVTGRANIRKTLENFQPGKINILLAHTINVFLDIGEDEMDLSFSGHSHGGQVCAPFFGPIIIHTVFGKEFVSGVRKLKGAFCSISRGVGASRYFFFRFLAPPEAIILTAHGK